MDISGAGQTYFQNHVLTKKGSKSAGSTETTGSMREYLEAKEMEAFKKEFYEDLSRVTSHRTVSNGALNISEEAFRAMKDDPGYREKVLSLIQRDWGDSYAPRNCSVLITVGAGLSEYRADSWPVGYDSEFDMRSQNSFYKRTSDAKKKHRELLDEYMEQRARMKEFRLGASDYDEKAFEMVGPNAPQEVKDAWMEAARQVNANGLGIKGNGMMSHISQMMVQRFNKMMRGEVDPFNILGNTTESAIQATKQALYDLEHPLADTPKSMEVQQARIRERDFYLAFLEKLEQVQEAPAK